MLIFKQLRDKVFFILIRGVLFAAVYQLQEFSSISDIFGFIMVFTVNPEAIMSMMKYDDPSCQLQTFVACNLFSYILYHITKSSRRPYVLSYCSCIPKSLRVNFLWLITKLQPLIHFVFLLPSWLKILSGLLLKALKYVGAQANQLTRLVGLVAKFDKADHYSLPGLIHVLIILIIQILKTWTIEDSSQDQKKISQE